MTISWDSSHCFLIILNVNPNIQIHCLRCICVDITTVNLNSLKCACQSLQVMVSPHFYAPATLVLIPGWRGQFLTAFLSSFLYVLHAWPESLFGLDALLWLFFLLIYSIFLMHSFNKYLLSTYYVSGPFHYYPVTKMNEAQFLLYVPKLLSVHNFLLLSSDLFS